MVIGKIHNYPTINKVSQKVLVPNEEKSPENVNRKSRLYAVRAGFEMSRIQQRQQQEEEFKRYLSETSMQCKQQLEVTGSNVIKAEKNRHNYTLQQNAENTTRRNDLKRRNSMLYGFGSSTPRLVCTTITRSTSVINCSYVGLESNTSKQTLSTSSNFLSVTNTCRQRNRIALRSQSVSTTDIRSRTVIDKKQRTEKAIKRVNSTNRMSQSVSCLDSYKRDQNSTATESKETNSFSSVTKSKCTSKIVITSTKDKQTNRNAPPKSPENRIVSDESSVEETSRYANGKKSKIPKLKRVQAQTKANVIARRRSSRIKMHDSVGRGNLKCLESDEDKLNEIRRLIQKENQRQAKHEKKMMVRQRRLSCERDLTKSPYLASTPLSSISSSSLFLSSLSLSTTTSTQKCETESETESEKVPETQLETKTKSAVKANLVSKSVETTERKQEKKSTAKSTTSIPLKCLTSTVATLATPNTKKLAITPTKKSTTSAHSSTTKFATITKLTVQTPVKNKIPFVQTSPTTPTVTKLDKKSLTTLKTTPVTPVSAAKKSTNKSATKTFGTPTHVISAEEAKLALSERRHAARIAAQLKAAEEAELARLRLEAEQKRIEAEEAEQHRLEEETLRLLEIERKAEELRLQQAIAEAQLKQKEELVRKEAEQKEKMEKEKFKLEEIERQQMEMEERARKEEIDRAERKKRVDAIMARTRRSTPIKDEPSKHSVAVTAV